MEVLGFVVRVFFYINAMNIGGGEVILCISVHSDDGLVHVACTQTKKK